MAVYSPTGVGVQQDQILTNISLDYAQNVDYIGEKLFPTVPVKKQAGKYFVFGKEAWIPENGDYRAPGTEANEIPGLDLSNDGFFCQEHALQIPVTDEERENVDSPLAPDRDGAELVTGKILLSREIAMKKMVTNPANYAAGLSVALAGTQQWSDYTGSDPVGDIKKAVRAIHAKVFMDPNLAVIPYQVMSVLEDHPKIMQRIMYTDRAILTPEIIQSVLGLTNVLVPGVSYATSPVGTSGNSVVGAYLWGKDVLLAYVPQRPGIKTPAFGYEFSWTYGGQVMTTDRWREDKRKSDLIRVSRRYDLKMVGTEQNPDSADYGKSITGFLYKNVIA